MSLQSQWRDVPIPNMSIPTFVFNKIASFGDRVALVHHVTGQTLTYRQLEHQSRQLAHGLQSRGFAKGDVFAVFCPNVPEYAVVLLGVALAGGIVTTANPNYTARELAHQLKDAGAQYVLTTPAHVNTIMGMNVKFKDIFVLGAAGTAVPFAQLLQNHGEPKSIAIDPQGDLAILPYSSGTTSLPKGVCLTHHNIVANLCQVACKDFNDLSLQDTLAGLLPFFHIYGMIVVLMSGLVHGVRIVTFEKFEPKVFLEALQQHKVTMVHVAPPIVHFLTKHPDVDQYDLRSLRDLFSAAAPLGMELAQACVQRLKCGLRQGYGMTEMAPISHMLPYKAQHKHSSIGRLVPNMSLKIVDLETGRPVGPGQTGEFWLKGPNVMQGYLNNAAATAATIDAEGYLHTGDLGYMDADGDCYIVDRCKELIKVKGFQVAPAELEDVLQGHPAVQDCAVVGITVDGEEYPKAFIVLREGVAPAAPLAKEIIDVAARQTAPYKRIRDVAFIQAIPKSASGKILRRELRLLPSKL